MSIGGCENGPFFGFPEVVSISSLGSKIEGKTEKNQNNSEPREHVLSFIADDPEKRTVHLLSAIINSHGLTARVAATTGVATTPPLFLPS